MKLEGYLCEGKVYYNRGERLKSTLFKQKAGEFFGAGATSRKAPQVVSEGLLNVFRSSAFTNWGLLQLGSYPSPTGTEI